MLPAIHPSLTVTRALTAQISENYLAFYLVFIGINISFLHHTMGFILHYVAPSLFFYKLHPRLDFWIIVAFSEVTTCPSAYIVCGGDTGSRPLWEFQLSWEIQCFSDSPPPACTSM